MKNDEYTKKLIDVLLDKRQWPSVSFSEDFEELSLSVQNQPNTTNVSGKIAAIFVLHQIVHEMTKCLIKLSNLYVQGEIWPTKYNIAFDKDQEKMTGWYLTYYSDSCITHKNKKQFLRHAKEVNRLRNEVAHNITGKNKSIIENTYKKFNNEFYLTTEAFLICENDAFERLVELTDRVDFNFFT